jgi:hypothetical protein
MLLNVPGIVNVTVPPLLGSWVALFAGHKELGIIFLYWMLLGE